MRGQRVRSGPRRTRRVSWRTSGCRRTGRSPWNDRPPGSSRRDPGDMPWNSRRSLQEPRRASPTPHLFLFLLLFLGFRWTHEPLREDPFEDDLHVHRIVLKEGRGGDDRQIVVVVQEAFRERLEAQVTLLDRRIPQLVTVRMLDAAEMRVDVTAIGDLLDPREDVVEVLRALEQPEAAGVHMREVQNREDALRVLHERQDLVQAADDLCASARFDPEAGVDLRLLVRVPDGPEGLGDPIQGLLLL